MDISPAFRYDFVMRTMIQDKVGGHNPATSEDGLLRSAILEAENDTERSMPFMSNRSDRRALWMNAVGIALCKRCPDRLAKAIKLARRWMREQPSRAELFREWERLLRHDPSTVLGPTSRNQQLRSVSPLAASITASEHMRALRWFQRINSHP
jgi:hypothetical protein